VKRPASGGQNLRPPRYRARPRADIPRRRRFRIPHSAFDGLNLIPHLRGERPLPVRSLFWRMGRQAAARDGDWKLLRTGEQPWQLFNLATDPAEQTNLAAAWVKWNQQNIPPLWGLPPGVRK
jgi:hypothetical protein